MPAAPHHCPHCGGILDREDANRPISERYRLACEAWADAEEIAASHEELKSAKFERMKSDLMRAEGTMPENKAERLVKASIQWEHYIKDMLAARAKANKLKLQVHYLKMKHSEWIGMDANARAERRL